MHSVKALKNIADRKFEAGIVLLWIVSRISIFFQLPIYMDEGILAFYANRTLKDPSLRFDIMTQDKGLLPSWISAWMSGLGLSPFTSVRIYALICSFLTMIIMFLISQKLFGVISAKLFLVIYTVNPFNLIHDVVGFLDPGVALTAVGSFYFLIKYFEKSDYEYIIIIGLIVGTGTLIRESSNYYVMLVPLSILIYQFRATKKLKITRIFLHISIFLSIVYPLYSIKRLTPLSYPHIKPTVENHYLFSDFIHEPFKYVSDNAFYYLQVLSGYSIAIMLLLAISLVNFKKLNSSLKVIWIISAIWALTPFVGALFFASLPSSRYIISGMPFLILISCSTLLNSKFNLIFKNPNIRINKILIILFSSLTLFQSLFMSINLQRYVLPGMDDWQYYRAQQLSGSGIKELVEELEQLTLLNLDYKGPIKVLGVNSYNNGILSVALNETSTFEKRQVDIFGYSQQPLADFDFVLIEEGNVGIYVSWGWPYYHILGNGDEHKKSPLFLDESFYKELNYSHDRVYEFNRPRNGATAILYQKK